MKRLIQEISIKILEYSDLTKIEKELLHRALNVRLKAQASYSHYWVGFSLVTDTGQFFDGCNVERCSYTQTDHAEQNAISSAVAKLGPCRIKAAASVHGPENQEIILPPKATATSIQRVGDICPACGHCLQIIAENCFDSNGKYDPTVPLLAYGWHGGEIVRTTIGDAYPMPFLPQHLGVNYAKDPRLKS